MKWYRNISHQATHQYEKCGLGLVALALLIPDIAHAAAGGTMPWDAPLTTLRNDLTGTVAFTLSLSPSSSPAWR
jgi:type IV secretory pathway VirB2 component (pilin)